MMVCTLQASCMYFKTYGTWKLRHVFSTCKLVNCLLWLIFTTRTRSHYSSKMIYIYWYDHVMIRWLYVEFILDIYNSQTRLPTCATLNSLMVRKGDSHPSTPGSIPGSGGWGLRTCAYRHELSGTFKFELYR